MFDEPVSIRSEYVVAGLPTPTAATYVTAVFVTANEDARRSILPALVLPLDIRCAARARSRSAMVAPPDTFNLSAKGRVMPGLTERTWTSGVPATVRASSSVESSEEAQNIV